MDKLILLVEDSPSDEKLATLAFKRSGIPHAMVVARDGVEALEYLHRTGRHASRDPLREPDVVLLDLNLPRIGGIEVLRRLRADARTRLLPVVILSASNEERDVAESFEAGANAYVRKPVDFLAFSDAAKTLGKFWLELNERRPDRGSRT